MTDDNLDRQAIAAALKGKWQDAIEINQTIISANPENTSALNRLGIAYLKTNDSANAKKTFLKVLEIDSFNSIAKTNLKKTSPKFIKVQQSIPLSNHTFSFIEESGKSKVIPLNNLGEPDIIANLYTGLEVQLKVAARKVKVTTPEGQYIGCLPDDISAHLVRLIRAGNKYHVLIKTADVNNIQIFAKEVKRAKKVSHIPSFNTSNFDDLDTGITNQPNQPPLEIYDPAEEQGLS